MKRYRNLAGQYQSGSAGAKWVEVWSKGDRVSIEMGPGHPDFSEEDMARYTFAVNFPLHSTPEHPCYWGAVIQVWTSTYPDPSVEAGAQRKLADILRKYLKVKGDFWFEFEEDEDWHEGVGWQVVPYEEPLLETWEARIEDEDGVTVHSENGPADELR